MTLATRLEQQDPARGVDAPLLKVHELTVDFHNSRGDIRAVDRLSLEVRSGETLAILGESGSGKSVTSLAILGLLGTGGHISSGSISFRGTELEGLSASEMRDVRGAGVSMIFQDPLSALNPVMKVGEQISEGPRRVRRLSRKQARAHAVDLMNMVRIPDAESRVDQYPHQFSGGMRQRVVIAMALALDPALIIADEPTTALDVTVQKQIISLLKDIQRRRGMGLVLISHDLGVVADVAQKVVVMYGGQVMESGPLRAVYDTPAHPYTVGLLRSVPSATAPGEQLSPIPGSPPDPGNPPNGCVFNPRCPMATNLCRTEKPPLTEVAPGRSSACHYAKEVLSDAKSDTAS